MKNIFVKKLILFLIYLLAYKFILFIISGLLGGIINGKFKPSDSHQVYVKSQKRVKMFKSKLPPYEPYTIQMQCLPLTSIIKAMGNPTIDYLSLDIEGAEFPVLQSIAFDEVDISVISIEVNHVGQIFDGRKANLDTLMRRNGYEFYKSVEIDDIWVKRGFLSSIDKEEL